MTGSPADTDPRAVLNGALRLDPERTAVVTVDMQREYLDRRVGANLVAEPDRTGVLARTGELLTVTRGHGIPTVHVYVVRRPAEVSRGLTKSPYSLAGTRLGLTQNPNAAPTGRPDRVEGSPQAELAAPLAGDGDVHVTGKKTMDCFYGTELDVLLRRAFRADTVIVAGVNTDTCVLSTSLSATNRGYRVVVAADCCASIRGRERHENALWLIGGSFAWVMTSAEIGSHLREHTGPDLT